MMPQIPALSATHASQMVKSGSSQLNLPVLIKRTPSGTTLQTAVGRYLITAPPPNLPKNEQSLLLRMPQALVNSAEPFSASLTLLGKPISIPLPTTLANQIRKAGIDKPRLLSLAKAGQGYLLGDAMVRGERLSFRSGFTVSFPHAMNRFNGAVRARITASGSEPVLTLEPVESEWELKLASCDDNHSNDENNQKPPQDKESVPKSESIPPADAESLLTAVEKRLRMAIHSHNSITAGREESSVDEDAAHSLSQPPVNRLKARLSRMGLIDTATEQQIPPFFEPAERLAAFLKPQNVAALMGADNIRQALSLATNSNLLPQTGDLELQFNQRPLGVVLQLLLAGLLQKREQVLTPLSRHWFALLANQAGLSLKELTDISSTELVEDILKLAQSRRAFSQLSNENDGWYFCLPYLLADKQQKIEGHWLRHRRRQDDESPTQLWQLRLRFSLKDGELLADANRNDMGLSLNLLASSQPLVERIENFLPVLCRHLQALGFSMNKLSCNCGKVPQSLFPSEQFSLDLRV